MPADECWTMLWVKVTSLTTTQGVLDPPAATVNATANPSWGWKTPTQLFSKTLPSMRRRAAFLTSKLFLTAQEMPAKAGLPGSQGRGLKRWLPRVSMSAGGRVGVYGLLVEMWGFPGGR